MSWNESERHLRALGVTIVGTDELIRAGVLGSMLLPRARVANRTSFSCDGVGSNASTENTEQSMSWEEHNRLVAELGIPSASRETLIRSGILGSTLLPRARGRSRADESASPIRGVRIAPTHDCDEAEDLPPLPDRGPELENCPFDTDDPGFGEGQVVEMSSHVFDDLENATYGTSFSVEAMLEFIGLQVAAAGGAQAEFDFMDGPRPLQPQGVRCTRPRLDRRAFVSLRRHRDRGIVISNRADAGKPLPMKAIGRAEVIIHSGTFKQDGVDEREFFGCEILSWDPFPRLRIEPHNAYDFELALRSTHRLIEINCDRSQIKYPVARQSRSNADSPRTDHGLVQLWLQGKPNGQARALQHVAPANSTQRWWGIDVSDPFVGAEFREILSDLNTAYGIDVSGRAAGTLHAGGAWELLHRRRLAEERKSRRRRSRKPLAPGIGTVAVPPSIHEHPPA